MLDYAIKFEDMREIVKTEKGYDAIWESGGGYTHTGDAICIADKNGKPKTPVYIRKRGELANRNHALFILRDGDIICKVRHHRIDFKIELYEVMLEKRILREISRYRQGCWVKPIKKEYEDLVDETKRKSMCYHCREMHYGNEIE